MKVKDYIIESLQLIAHDRPVASPLIMLIEQDVLDNEVLGTIKEILVDAMKSLTDKKKTERLAQSIALIEKIQKKEEESILHDKSELHSLEQEISDLNNE